MGCGLYNDFFRAVCFLDRTDRSLSCVNLTWWKLVGRQL